MTRHLFGKTRNRFPRLPLPAILAAAMLLAGCAGVDFPASPKNTEAHQPAESRDERFRTALDVGTFHQAILAGNVARAEHALVQSPSLRFATNGQGKTALDLAVTVADPDPEIVRLLLRRSGTDADKEQAAHDRALMLAVRATPPRKEIIDLLLASGAEAFVPSKGRYAFETPFGLAVRRSELADAVSLLLQSGKLNPKSPLAGEYLQEATASPEAFRLLQAYGVPMDGSSELLRKTVANDSLDLLRQVLRQLQPLSEAAANDGARALGLAVYNCKFDAAGQLLDAGVPIQQPDDKQPGGDLLRTLSEQCGRSNADIDVMPRREALQKLLARGVNPNVGTKNLACPVWLGRCELPDEAMIVDFLSNGADPYLLAPGAETSPLGRALRQCDYVEDYENKKPGNVIALMLMRRPDTRNARVRDGLNRALSEMFGALGCPRPVNFEIADRLIAHGADVNALNDRGDTNLASTMFYKDDRVYAPAAAYLLAKGARIDALDQYKKRTALSWMLDYEHPRMDRVLWLVKRGARLDKVLKMSPLPVSLSGPDRREIVAQIRAASRFKHTPSARRGFSSGGYPAANNRGLAASR